MPPKQGCGILFFRKGDKKVLLFRRDDKPDIPYPNLLDIPGGMVEDNETADHAIVREMAEELSDLRTGSRYSLKNFILFKVYEDKQGTKQHIFCSEAEFNIEDLRLNEGQEMVWLAESELKSTTVAFNFADVIQEFFADFPKVVRKITARS